LVDIKGVPLNALHEAICPDPTLPLHLARVAAQVACATAVKAAAGAAAVEAISATGPRVPADVPMLGTTHGADEPDALAGGQGFDTSELLVPALRDIRAPAMYTALGPPGAAEPCTGSGSRAGGGPGAPPALNARASWLARRPVHGDALLSAVRLQPNEWGTPVVKHGAFALRDYAPWAAAGLPASEHGARAGMPLLACLPLRFTCGRPSPNPTALPPALAVLHAAAAPGRSHAEQPRRAASCRPSRCRPRARRRLRLRPALPPRPAAALPPVMSVRSCPWLELAGCGTRPGLCRCQEPLWAGRPGRVKHAGPSPGTCCMQTAEACAPRAPAPTRLFCRAQDGQGVRRVRPPRRAGRVPDAGRGAGRRGGARRRRAAAGRGRGRRAAALRG